MAGLPNIQALVKEHAQRAYVLAQIEKKPPGYDVTAWAILLMDNSYTKLKTRYENRVLIEQERLLSQADGVDVVERIFQEGFLPAIPADPPAALVAKIRAVHDAWFTEIIRRECDLALQPLVGQRRSKEVLFQAKVLVQQVLSRVQAELGYQPFEVKITMNKDGSFSLTPSKNTRPGM